MAYGLHGDVGADDVDWRASREGMLRVCADSADAADDFP